MRMHTKKTAALLLAIGVALSSVGCGSGGKPGFLKDLVPTTGKVTVGGKPLESATVNFNPDTSAPGARPAVAVTDASGMYDAWTLVAGVAPKDSKGAVPGNYTVTISRVAVPAGVTLPEGADEAQAIGLGAKQLVPAQYTDMATSTLRVT